MPSRTSMLLAAWATAMAGMTGCGKQSDVAVNPEARPAGPQQAVARGRAFLLARQMDDGSWTPDPENFPGGSTALATWALLASGSRPDDQKLTMALTWLGQLDTDKTYTLSIRANAWRAAMAAGAESYLSQLRADVSLLYSSAPGGSYTYSGAAPGTLGDQSNSHYGVMGVEAGVAGGLSVPGDYWKRVARYWSSVQNRDGGWPYSRPGTPSTPTMTAAGVATLALCDKQLGSEEAGSTRAVRDGRAWLDKHFGESLKDRDLMYYYFLAVQRMASLSDTRRLGGHSVSASIVRELLARQKADGSWDGPWGPDVSTAYAVLVLSQTP